MPILHRLLASIIALVFAAGVTGTFIVDDSSGADDSVTSGGTTSTIDTGPDGKKKGAENKPAESTAPSNAPKDTSSTTEAPAESTTTTTATTTTTTQATPTTAEQPRPGVTPTSPGNYIYDVTGTVDGEEVNTTSTLKVAEPDGEGRQTQVEEGDNGKTTTVYRFTGEGTYLESNTTEMSGCSFTLTPTSPFLVVPSNAQSGTVTTGQLEGDGLTADVTFTMVEMGAETSTAHVDTTISGEVKCFGFTVSVDGTTESTIIARSADQLPLEITAKSQIDAGPQSTSSDTRSVLRR